MPRVGPESYGGGGRDDDRDYGQGGWGYSGYAREGEQPVDVNRVGDLGDESYESDIERGPRVDSGGGRRGPKLADRRAVGPHRGQGPRNYVRSDERIHEDVCECLTDAPDLDASDIKVEVRDGEVFLSGEVDTRRDKRRAEDCAEDVRGVQHVQNNLRPRGRSLGLKYDGAG